MLVSKVVAWLDDGGGTVAVVLGAAVVLGDADDERVDGPVVSGVGLVEDVVVVVVVVDVVVVVVVVVVLVVGVVVVVVVVEVVVVVVVVMVVVVVVLVVVVVVGAEIEQPAGLQQHRRRLLYVAAQVDEAVAPKQALSCCVRMPGWLGDDPEA